MGMPAYPLDPLLSIRRIRAEDAKRAVRDAERVVREAEEGVRQRLKELAEYEAWWPTEQDRRYEAIMRRPQTQEMLERFKAGLAELKAGVIVREEDVNKAKKVLEEKKALLDKARKDATRAAKETSKIEVHKDIWSIGAAKEAERKEELELEDFHPAPLAEAEDE